MSQYANDEEKERIRVLFESHDGELLVGQFFNRKQNGWKDVVKHKKCDCGYRPLPKEGDELEINGVEYTINSFQGACGVKIHGILGHFKNIEVDVMAAIDRLASGKKQYIKVTDDQKVLLTGAAKTLEKLFKEFGYPMGMFDDFTTIKQQIKSGATSLEQGINKFKGVVDQYIESVKVKIAKYCKSMPACEAVSYTHLTLPTIYSV